MVGVPKHLALAWFTYFRHLNEVTLVDLLWSLTDALPSGLYDGMALERYMRSVLTMPGRSNCFSDLEKRLHVIATDLNTGERAVFGSQHCDDVPISLAVAASSAVPMLYKPVCILDREYIDGGMRGTASIDLAIEQGATLVVCINPLVPYRRPENADVSRGESLSARGVPAIASQVTRISSHAGLRYQIKQLRRQHPEVDIILIEPQPTDQRMFVGNIMHYQARLAVARHGFESVTLDLAQDYASYKETLARHGVPITRRLVIEELAEIHDSGFDPGVIRRVLEARTHPCARHKRNTPYCQLQQALARLELELDAVDANTLSVS
jgi:NTE family protein